ncbi:MAG: recombinase RecQ, partial [Verrucomicrobiaceae bacterium]
DQLSTYGVLRDKGAGYLNALTRSLADAGLVMTIPGEYPLMTLTSTGEKVMRGERAFTLCWPDADAGGKQIHLKDHGFEGGLYALLRDLRTRIAKKEDVPPYVVFSNKTLEGLVRYRPTDVEQAMQVPGIGAGKAQRYLPPFLKLIAAWK